MYRSKWDLWIVKGGFDVDDEATPIVSEGEILADVDRLAARVHAAWMAEKQRQEFADHPFQCAHPPFERNWCIAVEDCEKNRAQHHPDMVPFEELPDATKDDDRATVRAVLTALIEEDTP